MNMVVLTLMLVMVSPDMADLPTMVQAMILTDMAGRCTALVIRHKEV